MSARNVRVGDMVLVDKKGRTFHAEVTDVLRDGRRAEFTVRPISRNITWHTATSREIVKHWRASRGG